ncbi:MAG: hypothetical protein ACTSV3_03625 [Candidatus Thorarchaeota archaeon]|nr:MAG: hypothetical protein DRP09_03545 [Candidatus Thorarchaeota archaeon]RLI59495.1 MAG: hypothetical protein DRO87_02815 [Candidatus Thorarchaeota archaeon]
MASRCISRQDILRSTLFHIQVKNCQYIDNFPEVVATVLDGAVTKNGIREYNEIKRKLYRIKTNFFKINSIKKRDFFKGLYQRIENKTR